VTVIPDPLVIPVGFAIGMMVAVPVGPVNVLCIQRAITRGFWGGLAAGLGAVLGDGLIALFAALGVGAIAGVVETYRVAIQLIGGGVLILFGARLATAPAATAVVHMLGGAPGSLRDYIWDIPKTFALTVTNPAAVLGVFTIFGSLSTYVEVTTTVDALTLVAAVMAGSLAWWISLSAGVARVRLRLDLAWLRTVNVYAGVLLIAFGVFFIGDGIWKRG
jgi:threonine/homoserine/homoserine lactone efflux protein